MKISELKQQIIDKTLPKDLIFIDNCHTLIKEYIKAISYALNRKPVHVYSISDAESLTGRFDRKDILGIVHNCGKYFRNVAGLADVHYIFIEDSADDLACDYITFPKLNKNQCILYIENWLEENGFFNKIDSKKILTLSRDSIEKLIDYFDADLDMIMNELNKLKCLEVHALEKPFQALFESLPPKNKSLKSLPWFSGGAVDTAQVLYATYMKKLKSADKSVPIKKQMWYTQLIVEAIFVENEILSGKFGDYALEYFKLIEKLSPEEYQLQWFPPVSREEIGPEWKLD